MKTSTILRRAVLLAPRRACPPHRRSPSRPSKPPPAARPTSRAASTCHGPNLRQLPNALLAGDRVPRPLGQPRDERADRAGALDDAARQSRRPAGGNLRERRRVPAASERRRAERERDRRGHDGARRRRPHGPSSPPRQRPQRRPAPRPRRRASSSRAPCRTSCRSRTRCCATPTPKTG